MKNYLLRCGDEGVFLVLSWSQAWKIAGNALRVNWLPGLVLQICMLGFFALYLWHAGIRDFLQQVALAKDQAGYFFAFGAYMVSSAFLPELLKIVFFQKGRILSRNIESFVTAAPFWGMIGVLADAFYRLQAVWFGADNSLVTIVLKTSVDQLIFSPFFCTPLCLAYMSLRDRRFQLQRWWRAWDARFFVEKAFSVQVAGWCIWIPGVMLVYSMPPMLQIPVAVLIQTFWVMIFTFIQERKSECTQVGFGDRP